MLRAAVLTFCLAAPTKSRLSRLQHLTTTLTTFPLPHHAPIPHFSIPNHTSFPTMIVLLPLLTHLLTFCKKFPPSLSVSNIKPLSGGLTNTNFIINGDWVYRINGDHSLPSDRNFEVLHGMNRDFERLVMIRMNQEHVSPLVLFGDSNRLVTALLRNAESSTRICGESLQKGLIPLLEVVHKVRDIPLANNLHMNALSFIQKYWNLPVEQTADNQLRFTTTIGALVAESQPELAKLLENCQYLWELSTDRLFTPSLIQKMLCVCHNDLVGGNLIHTKNDDRYWLIDWEYASIGIGLHDYANLAAVNNYTEEEDRGLFDSLEKHFEEHFTEEERAVLLAQHTIVKVLQNIREGLWGIVMHYMIPGLKFDCSWSDAKSYEEYGLGHLKQSYSFMKGENFVQHQKILERELKNRSVRVERLMEIANAV